MSGPGKRTFASFVKPAGTVAANNPPEPTQSDISGFARSTVVAEAPRSIDAGAGQGSDTQERLRVVTPSGRVRTYTASRSLPGVTLRMTEVRWERLKLLSIQERRPIQEILGEAMADFMRARGLPW